jgi:hypothetical protein
MWVSSCDANYRDSTVYIILARRVLRLRMEETPSSYGGKLRIYWISSRGQPTRGGPPAWGLCVGLATPHRKNKLVTKTFTKPRTWRGPMWTRWWTSGFHKMLGSSRVAAQLAASQEGLSSMSEWVWHKYYWRINLPEVKLYACNWRRGT